jgi:hypothetical protein
MNAAFDRRGYMREYMRAWRARRRQELRPATGHKSPEYSDPLEELAGAWAPFVSGLAWAAWCEQDRRDELDEQLGDVRDEELAAIAADVEPPAEVIPMPVTKPGRRAA